MISLKEVQRIAKLARIDISEKEMARFQKELASILEYFEILEGVDVSAVEPMTHGLIGKNVTRQDEAKPKTSSETQTLIEMAPAKQDGYVKVKSMF